MKARMLIRELLVPYRKKAKKTRLWEYSVFPVLYLTSSQRARRHPEVFNEISTYCLFVGHGRSGHSIMGALLDAHPNAVVADELDTLRIMEAGFRKEQICEIIISRSARQAGKGRIKSGREGTHYSYYVPGQWQGAFQRLEVVGDTQAGLSTRRLHSRPYLLRRLEEVMAVPVRIIHLLRNPFDNISTLMLRSDWTFEQAIDRYFENCETISRIRAEFPESRFLVLRHEDLLATPGTILTEACRFLGLRPDTDYLQACSSVLYESPAKSRQRISWTTPLIDRVQSQIERFPFLSGYGFES